MFWSSKYILWASCSGLKSNSETVHAFACQEGVVSSEYQLYAVGGRRGDFPVSNRQVLGQLRVAVARKDSAARTQMCRKVSRKL